MEARNLNQGIHNHIAYQELMFDMHFDQVVKYFKDEFTSLLFSNTTLETMKLETIPGITVYVDYAVKGFDCMNIELLEVHIMNQDDEHLTKSETSLKNALQEIVWEINGSEVCNA